jgi:ActR/RegA family two-component response regulator
MGYYENPPILNLNPGADKITAGIMDAADSISKALLKRGEDRREEEKQRKLSVQRIQEEKN